VALLETTMASFKGGEYDPDIGTVQLPIWENVMGIRFSGTRMAVVTAAFVIAPAWSAVAQFNPSGFGGPNTSDRMGGGGGGKGATAKTTVKSSKSNTSDRMGGGGGKGGANKAINLNSSRSN
jgi:hypothetical protein